MGARGSCYGYPRRNPWRRVSLAEFTDDFATHNRGMETLTALRGRMVAALLVLALAGLWGSASGARAAVPNDPAFPLQWADRNTGQKIPFQDNSETLGAPENG